MLDFSETDDSWLEDEDLAVFLKSASEMLMVEDLSRRCGFLLEVGSPFTYDWDGLVSLWSNYNISEKFRECGPDNFDKVKVILTEAMNEGKQHPDSFMEWWFDWNNEVVSSIKHIIHPGLTVLFGCGCAGRVPVRRLMSMACMSMTLMAMTFMIVAFMTVMLFSFILFSDCFLTLYFLTWYMYIGNIVSSTLRIDVGALAVPDARSFQDDLR